MKYTTALILLILLLSACTVNHPGKTIPVIYSTDLFHPHMDPDDHFDLACLFAIKEFDIRAVIIDNTAGAGFTPGTIPVEQMEKITGRKVEVATGLKDCLSSPDDDGSGQAGSRGAVDLILRTLEESELPVTIITVGSTRDVAAAFNADQELFRKKAGRIFVFAGDASVTDPKIFREYNVGLDTLAFERIMNSGLDIYWVPCFDGGPFVNRGQASYLLSQRDELFSRASQRVMNFFRYALLKSSDSLFLEALDARPDSSEINTITRKQENGTRNLWCSHVFPYIAGRDYINENGSCRSVAAGTAVTPGTVIQPFIFTAGQYKTGPDGMVRPCSGTGASRLNLFTITDRDSFTAAMTSVVSFLLQEADEK